MAYQFIYPVLNTRKFAQKTLLVDLIVIARRIGYTGQRCQAMVIAHSSRISQTQCAQFQRVGNSHVERRQSHGLPHS